MLLCWPIWSLCCHLCLFYSFFFLHNSTIFVLFLLHIMLIQLLSKSCTTRQHQRKRPQADWNTEGIFKNPHYINHVAVLNSYSVRRPLYLVWKCKSAGLLKKKKKKNYRQALYTHQKLPTLLSKCPEELLDCSMPNLRNLTHSWLQCKDKECNTLEIWMLLCRLFF